MKKSEIKPFQICEHADTTYSVSLWQDYFVYDWIEEIKKVTKPRCGDGYYYNDVFKDYLEAKYSELNKRLHYDSESGMFCVYCKNIEDARKVASELSKIYNNEKKMIELIKISKLKYEYIFDPKI